MNADLYVICTTHTLAPALAKDHAYYAFRNGDTHLYISKHDRRSAHTGCFQAHHFQEKQPNTASVTPGQFYKATLATTDGQYPGTQLGTYYLLAGTTHAKFYEDQERTRFCGQFPLAWFTDLEEAAWIEQAPALQPNDKTEADFATEPQIEQLSLF